MVTRECEPTLDLRFFWPLAVSLTTSLIKLAEEVREWIGGTLPWLVILTKLLPWWSHYAEVGGIKTQTVSTSPEKQWKMMIWLFGCMSMAPWDHCRPSTTQVIIWMNTASPASLMPVGLDIIYVQVWTYVGHIPGAGCSVPRSSGFSLESSCRHWSRSSRSTRSTSHSPGRAPTCKSKTQNAHHSP